MKGNHPVYITARIRGKGNHGHQLKDLLGALVIARLFKLEYVHSPYPYLDFSGIQTQYRGVAEIRSQHVQLKRKKVSVGRKARGWTGLSLNSIRQLIAPILRQPRNKPLLLVLDNGPGRALRVHPCQVSHWHSQGLIRDNIFEELSPILESSFLSHDFQSPPQGHITIAAHINRGSDYHGKTLKAKGRVRKSFGEAGSPRYFFPLSYYERIFSQIQRLARGYPYGIKIYTEKLNSDAIVKKFKEHPNIQLCIGRNREEGDHSQVQDIFHQFIASDILIVSNSSFSSTASYFRGKRPTIYHPHDQLFGLPADRYLPTDLEGNFNVERLKPLFSI